MNQVKSPICGEVMGRYVAYVCTDCVSRKRAAKSRYATALEWFMREFKPSLWEEIKVDIVNEFWQRLNAAESAPHSA